MVEKRLKNFEKRFNETIFTLNISPDDAYQYSKHGLHRFEMYRDWFIKEGCKFMSLQKCHNFRLYPDVSFASEFQNGRPRIHYHGWIQFDDNHSLHNFLMSFVPVHCRVEIDTIDDWTQWLRYCKKYKETVNPPFADVIKKKDVKVISNTDWTPIKDWGDFADH